MRRGLRKIMTVKDAKKQIENAEWAVSFMSDVKNTGFRQFLEEHYKYEDVDRFINAVRNSLIRYKGILNKAIDNAEIDLEE